MGIVYSRFSNLFNMDVRILLLGLDSAGKTTTLYRLKLNEIVSTIPTIGFNIESLTYKKMNITMWDVGGQDRIRPLWKYYFQNTDALIFMVDAADPNRFEEAKEELFRIYSNEIIKKSLKAIVVFANKSDLPGACSVQKVCDALGLNDIRGILWHVQATNAVNGMGLYEGLDNLHSMISAKK